MKLSIERTSLLKTLGNVQKVVERRTTIPILANVKLAASGDKLSLTATDMDLTVQSDSPAEIEREGATTVSAHTLFDIVRKLPEGSVVTIDQPPGTSEMQLAAGRSQFTLPTLPADEYPAMESEELDLRFNIPVEDLKKLIDKTRFAISTEETRYYLNGIHVHAMNGDGAASVLRGVATDGHRLSRIEIALPDGAAGIPPIIIPRKTIQELRGIIDEVTGEITIGVSPKRIQFLLDTTILLSRLIDGQFPDYERVIPTNNDKTAFVDAKPLAETVDRVSTIATERARAIKLGFQSGGLVVSAVSSEAGRAIEEIDARYEYETLEIGFNARYMLDILSEIEGDEVQIQLNNPAAPTLLRDPGDSSTLLCFDAHASLMGLAAVTDLCEARIQNPALTKLSLRDFRNYQQAEIEFDARVVVLVGPNGAGKTNCLEAISLFSPGRGLRRAGLDDMDRDGAGTLGFTGRF